MGATRVPTLRPGPALVRPPRGDLARGSRAPRRAAWAGPPRLRAALPSIARSPFPDPARGPAPPLPGRLGAQPPPQSKMPPAPLHPRARGAARPAILTAHSPPGGGLTRLPAPISELAAFLGAPGAVGRRDLWRCRGSSRSCLRPRLGAPPGSALGAGSRRLRLSLPGQLRLGELGDRDLSPCGFFKKKGGGCVWRCPNLT